MVLPAFLHGRAALSLANVLSCAARLGSARRFEESLPAVPGLPDAFCAPTGGIFVAALICVGERRVPRGTELFRSCEGLGAVEFLGILSCAADGADFSCEGDCGAPVCTEALCASDDFCDVL